LPFFHNPKDIMDSLEDGLPPKLTRVVHERNLLIHLPLETGKSFSHRRKKFHVFGTMNGIHNPNLMKIVNNITNIVLQSTKLLE
jgi:hypothetical protein